MKIGFPLIRFQRQIITHDKILITQSYNSYSTFSQIIVKHKLIALRELTIIIERLYSGFISLINTPVIILWQNYSNILPVGIVQIWVDACGEDHQSDRNFLITLICWCSGCLWMIWVPSCYYAGGDRRIALLVTLFLPFSYTLILVTYP